MALTIPEFALKSASALLISASPARIDAISDYTLPIVVGVSRKSFVGRLLDRPVDQRLAGTIAANLAALLAGANILRVHDVAAHQDALTVLDAVEGRK